MKRLVLLLLLSFPVRPEVSAAWTPEFSLRFETIGAVAPSPDGQWVAYTQSKPIIAAERSEWVSQIFVARVRNGSRRFQLTRGDAGASAPAFSPDGYWVYFLSERSGKTQLYRIRIEGGEAQKLTDFTGALGSFKIAPDGKQIMFTGHETPPDAEKAKKEKTGFSGGGCRSSENHAL